MVETEYSRPASQRAHRWFDGLRKRPVEGAVSIIVLIVLFVLVAYPLIMLVFGAPATSAGGRETGLTVDGIVRTLSSERFHIAWKNTLISSFFATILAVVTGIVLSFFVERTDIGAKALFRTLLMLPLFVAPFIGAIAWTGMAAPRVGVLNRIFEWLGLPFAVDIYSMVGVTIVLGLYKVPYVYFFTSGTLRSIDGSLEEASRISGRGLLYTLYKITLPLIWPSIVSVSLLCLVLTVENFSILAIIALPARIPFVATELYLNFTQQPPDYSYATISAILLIAFTIFGLWLQRRVNRSQDFITVSGKGHKAEPIKLGRWRHVFTAIMGFYLFVTVALPMLVLVFASIQPFWATNVASFTLENYQEILSRGSVVGAIKNSIFLAVFGGLLAALLAVTVSYIVLRTESPVRNMIDFLSSLPISIPSIAFGVALLWAWIAVPLPIFGTIWILLIAYVTKYMTMGVRNVSAALTQVSPELEAAARVFGATQFQAARAVTFPLVRNSIFGSWVLAFASMIKELNLSILLYSFGSIVFPILIFDAHEEGDFTMVAAMSVMLSVATLLSVFIARRVLKIQPETSGG